jgi:YD repeat-containing protein
MRPTNSWTFAYDGERNLLHRTNPNQHVWNYTYNPSRYPGANIHEVAPRGAEHHTPGMHPNETTKE